MHLKLNLKIQEGTGSERSGSCVLWCFGRWWPFVTQWLSSLHHLGDSSYSQDFCLNNYCRGNHQVSSSISDWYHSDGLCYRGGIFVTTKAVVTIGTLKGSRGCVPLWDAALILHSVCMDSTPVYKYVCGEWEYSHIEWVNFVNGKF